jgi:hypothetical protein
MKSYLSPILTLVLLLAVSATTADAAEGGYSNYVPGTYGDFGMALEPAGKLTLRNDIHYYNADVTRSIRSGRLEAEAELSFLLNMTTLLYKPDIEIFGGQYAFGTMIPVVHAEFEAGLGAGSTTLRASDDTTNIGDITLVPVALYWNWGKAHLSFGQYIIAPTGDYDVNNLVNAGLNYWSFDTNFAFTWLNADAGREFSANLGHLYNTENGATDHQTGQEIHLDVAANQYLSDNFAIGVHGFYLDQITGDSGSGALLGDFEARAAGIGPAIMWGTKIGRQDVTFIAKWLHEFDADNRLQGDHVMLSIAMDW